MTKHQFQFSPHSADFIWASGIEDTFVPQTRPRHRALDEYQLVGHYQHWREDLALARDLKLDAIRWGVPWYRVEPFPGEFDWRWTDQVIPYIVQDLKIAPIIDLMHYGCPFWLYEEFANPDYPARVAAYAAAFAERYRDLIRYYTPLNEPHVNAVWCGGRGIWPPYLRGEKGYIRILLQLAKGILRTVRALKSIDSDAVMVHVEATGITRSGHPDYEARAAKEQARGFLSYDLISGRVTPEHPVYEWLTSNNVHPNDLAAMVDNPITLDIIGLNFYPQWSTKEITQGLSGQPVYRIVDRDGKGFARLVESYYERYRAPMMITETSARGAGKVRAAWLDHSLAAVKDMRSRGIPVLGYTWFPMFTMYDWRYRTGRGPLEDYRLELGFYKLRRHEEEPRWTASALVERWHHHRANPAQSIGELQGWDTVAMPS